MVNKQKVSKHNLLLLIMLKHSKSTAALSDTPHSHIQHSRLVTNVTVTTLAKYWKRDHCYNTNNI